MNDLLKIESWIGEEEKVRSNYSTYPAIYVKSDMYQGNGSTVDILIWNGQKPFQIFILQLNTVKCDILISFDSK